MTLVSAVGKDMKHVLKSQYKELGKLEATEQVVIT